MEILFEEALAWGGRTSGRDGEKLEMPFEEEYRARRSTALRAAGTNFECKFSLRQRQSTDGLRACLTGSASRKRLPMQ